MVLKHQNIFLTENPEYEMIRKTIKIRAFEVNHWKQSTIFDDEFGIFTFLSRKCFRATYLLTFSKMSGLS